MKVDKVEALLLEFEAYIDAHETDRIKANDKKTYVREQTMKVPGFMRTMFLKSALKAARSKYE